MDQYIKQREQAAVKAFVGKLVTLMMSQRSWSSFELDQRMAKLLKDELKAEEIVDPKTN